MIPEKEVKDKMNIQVLKTKPVINVLYLTFLMVTYSIYNDLHRKWYKLEMTSSYTNNVTRK